MRSFESGFNPGATKFSGRSNDAVENLWSLDKRGLRTDTDAFRLVTVVEIERHVKGNTGDSPLHPEVSKNDVGEVTTESFFGRGQRKWNDTGQIAVFGKPYQQAVRCGWDWPLLTPEVKFVFHREQIAMPQRSAHRWRPVTGFRIGRRLRRAAIR